MRPILKSKLAEIAGVSKPAISRLVNRGKLKVAVKGDYIDLDHPAVRAYLASKGISKVPAVPPPKGAPPPTTPPKEDDSPVRPPTELDLNEPTPEDLNREWLIEAVVGLFPDAAGKSFADIKKVARMTINEVVNNFGGIAGCREWVLTQKALEEVRFKTLRTNVEIGKYIAREVIEHTYFSHMEGLHKRLLNDLPRTMVARISELTKSGASQIAMETAARQIASQLLEQTIAEIKKVLE